MKYNNMNKILKLHYVLPFALICFSFLTGCVEDPLKNFPADVLPVYNCKYDNDIDFDCDGLTDNVEYYGMNFKHKFKPHEPDTDPSVANGYGCTGSLTDGINLPDVSGRNYNHYYGTDCCNTDDWGTGKLIFVLSAAAYELENKGPGKFDGKSESSFEGPLLIGDLSKESGGCWEDHYIEYPDDRQICGHTNGLDADLRYICTDFLQISNYEDRKVDISLNRDKYDECATQNVFLAFAEVYGDIKKIFVDKGNLNFADITIDGKSIFSDYAGHSNHFHVEIKCPDGQCK